MTILSILSTLIELPLSFQSLEVVNRLTGANKLPEELIRKFVLNAINQCGKMKNDVQQKRMIRLLCLFLQVIIGNKTVNIESLFVEIQTFCIEFSGIKEANDVFRLLKMTE